MALHLVRKLPLFVVSLKMRWPIYCNVFLVLDVQ